MTAATSTNGRVLQTISRVLDTAGIGARHSAQQPRGAETAASVARASEAGQALEALQPVGVEAGTKAKRNQAPAPAKPA